MPKQKGEFTTIWISRQTKKALDSIKRPRETYDELIARIISGEEGAVFIDFISIDGKPAKEHTIIFQLGDRPPRYYMYKRGNFRELRYDEIEIKVKENEENPNREA